MAKLEDLIDPQLIDEIVDEILAELKTREEVEEKPAEEKTEEAKPETETPAKSLSTDELVKLKNQLEELKKAFEIEEIEVERELNEKVENVHSDLESHIDKMEGDVTGLKDAMVKLATEIKKMKENKP